MMRKGLGIAVAACMAAMGIGVALAERPDLPAEGGLHGQEDAAHPSAAELPLDAIGPT
jgi:hypothetical protein